MRKLKLDFINLFYFINDVYFRSASPERKKDKKKKSKKHKKDR